MANNGLRQLGQPRIDVYADRQKPEPFHLEVNNWEHTLDLLYKVCVQSNVVDELVNIIIITDGGCGLKSTAENIHEHYKCEKKDLIS